MLVQGGDEGGDAIETGGAAVFRGVVGGGEIFDRRAWGKEGEQIGGEPVGHLCCYLMGEVASEDEGGVSRASRAATPLMRLRLQPRLWVLRRG